MRRVYGGIGVMTCLAVTVNVLAGSDERGKEATHEAVLRSLKPLPAGGDETSYFEMQMEAKTVGYMSVSLQAVGRGEVRSYLYINESQVRLPDKSRSTGSVVARLGLNFEPIKIQMKRTEVGPGGIERSATWNIAVGATEITLSQTEGARVRSRKVPRPDGAFVFGLEALVQRIPLDRYPSFSLNVLSQQAGQVAALTFTSDVGDDGTRVLEARDLEGKLKYRFTFARSGQLVQWDEQARSLTAKRVTKKRVQELKAKMSKG